MKLTIQKNNLIKTLQNIQSIVERKVTLPILSNIKLVADNNKIEIYATNIETSCKSTIPAEIKKSGDITINARKFFEITKELPEENIEISVGENSRITIKSGKSRFNINGLPASEFPSFPEYNEGVLTVIDTEVVKEMIDRTIFAVSTEEYRHNITGIFFEAEEGKVKMAATDGYRLASIEKPTETEIKLNKGVIIPRRGILEIKKILDNEGSLLAGITDNSMAFKKGNTVLIIRLIEGEFPSYGQVIPKDNNKLITISREVLASAIRRVSVLSSDKIRGIKFSISKGKMSLYSNNPDLGDALEEIDIKYDGDDMEVAFNVDYMLDVLNILYTNNINLELKDSGSAGIIKTGLDDGYTYVIMPMRV